MRVRSRDHFRLADKPPRTSRFATWSRLWWEVHSPHQILKARVRAQVIDPRISLQTYPFLDQDADNLWLQPLDGSPGKQITNFKSERITDFHWSFDGSKVGMVRGHTDSDVVLLQESKP